MPNAVVGNKVQNLKLFHLGFMLLKIFKIIALYIPDQQDGSFNISKDGLHYKNKMILAHFIINKIILKF
jgi:hypothetical protein